MMLLKNKEYDELLQKVNVIDPSRLVKKNGLQY